MEACVVADKGKEWLAELTKRSGSEPIPGYRLLTPLGRGGFGEVWTCEAPGGIFKAIKFVYDQAPAFGPGQDPAEQELSSLQRIKDIRHPFLVSLDRVERVGGELIIVMELADKTLYDRMQECQRSGLSALPRPEVLGYLCEAAEVLDVMNFQHGLQHLDVKPANLFLVSNHVKVADFGLVQSLGTRGGPAEGRPPLGITPRYAAPEVFLGQPSAFSDQYSLAITYFELRTGSFPFSGTNSRQLAVQHAQGEPDLTNLPPSEQPVLARALSKDPEQRFPSCLEFVQALASAPIPEDTPAGQAVSATGLRRSLRETATGPRAAANSPTVSSSPTVPVPRSGGRLPQGVAPSPNWVDAVAELVKESAGPWQLWQTGGVRYRRRPGELLLHECVTRLPLDVVLQKLNQYARDTGARISRAEPTGFSFLAPATDRTRPMGLAPQIGLLTEIQLRPSHPLPMFTYLHMEVKPFGCRGGQADQLLVERGPTLLGDLRVELQARPERRHEERIEWQPALDVFPLLPGGEIGEAVQGRGLDISLHGIGLLLPHEPASADLIILLPREGQEQAVQVLARVVRCQHCPDKGCEIGAVFLARRPPG